VPTPALPARLSLAAWLPTRAEDEEGGGKEERPELLVVVEIPPPENTA